jgi:hypothetical protein
VLADAKQSSKPSIIDETTGLSTLNGEASELAALAFERDLRPTASCDRRARISSELR